MLLYNVSLQKIHFIESKEKQKVKNTFDFRINIKSDANKFRQYVLS